MYAFYRLSLISSTFTISCKLAFGMPNTGNFKRWIPVSYFVVIMFSKTSISDLHLENLPLSADLNVNNVPLTTVVSENSAPKWSAILRVKMLKWTSVFKTLFSGNSTHSFTPVILTLGKLHNSNHSFQQCFWSFYLGLHSQRMLSKQKFKLKFKKRCEVCIL